MKLIKSGKALKSKLQKLTNHKDFSVRIEARYNSIIVECQKCEYSQELRDFVLSISPDKQFSADNRLRLTYEEWFYTLEWIESNPQKVFTSSEPTQTQDQTGGERDIPTSGSEESKSKNPTPNPKPKRRGRVSQLATNEQIKEIITQKGNNLTLYTSEDLELLRQYSGDGAKKDKDTRESLTQFFTDVELGRIMVKLAYKHGFKKDGLVLEPSVGTGNLLAHLPKKENVTAFELDTVAAQICRILYPTITLHNDYFESAFFDKERGANLLTESWIENKFDLVIGNPPYGTHQNKYSMLLKPRFPNMEYSFLYHPARLLKKDGLLIYVTARNFLQGHFSAKKEMVLKQLELIDAYRLPNGAFQNTEVGTDILIFKKL